MADAPTGGRSMVVAYFDEFPEVCCSNCGFLTKRAYTKDEEGRRLVFPVAADERLYGFGLNHETPRAGFRGTNHVMAHCFVAAHELHSEIASEVARLRQELGEDPNEMLTPTAIKSVIQKPRTSDCEGRFTPWNDTLSPREHYDEWRMYSLAQLQRESAKGIADLQMASAESIARIQREYQQEAIKLATELLGVQSQHAIIAEAPARTAEANRVAMDNLEKISANVLELSKRADSRDEQKKVDDTKATKISSTYNRKFLALAILSAVLAGLSVLGVLYPNGVPRITSRIGGGGSNVVVVLTPTPIPQSTLSTATSLPSASATACPETGTRSPGC